MSIWADIFTPLTQHKPFHHYTNTESQETPRSTSSNQGFAKPSIYDRFRQLLGDEISEKAFEHRFQIGQTLGVGATAMVVEAIDRQHDGHKVALKIFDKASLIECRRSMAVDGAHARQEKAHERATRRLRKLLTEIETLYHVGSHPNLVPFHGAIETTHRVVIIYDLVEGSDLLGHLLTHGKLDESLVSSIFTQLAQALAHCHDRNVYHRDLKLENVLLTTDYQVKLIDFGLAERVAPGSKITTVCGTPLYCGPEVLSLPLERAANMPDLGFHGGPADVWSLGILLFALLTGCAPFDDSDYLRLREQVCKHSSRIPYPETMSDAAKGLLKTMLVFDPDMRPSIHDLLMYDWQTTDVSIVKDFSRRKLSGTESLSSTASSKYSDMGR